MFLSKDQLTYFFEIDAEIAAFFVDRKVPVNNAYWKGRMLYLKQNPGFLFLPLFVDVLYRLGIKKEALLNEEFVQLFESILHKAAEEEQGETTMQELRKESKNLVTTPFGANEAVQEYVRWLDETLVGREFLGGLKELPCVPALQRADSFLYALAILPGINEVRTRALEIWESVTGFYLFLDDVEDLDADRRKGESNIILEWGDLPDASDKARAFITYVLPIQESINSGLWRYSKELLEKFDIEEKLGISRKPEALG